MKNNLTATKREKTGRLHAETGVKHRSGPGNASPSVRINEIRRNQNSFPNVNWCRTRTRDNRR